MQTNAVTLRPETPADRHAVETLTREAFWNHHGPGCDEHYLAHTLRSDEAFLPDLCYVAEVNGQLAGSIFYARANILLDVGGTLPVVTFGPLSVLPAYQRMGVGRALVARTRELARAAGHAAILIYGDPAIYTRIGFVPAERYRIGTEDDRYGDPLMACELQAGALATAAGRFSEGTAYHVDAQAAETFNASFPPKEKVEGTPSQLRFLETIDMFRPRT